MKGNIDLMSAEYYCKTSNCLSINGKEDNIEKGFIYVQA